MNSRSLTDEERLLRTLFVDSGYNPSARPVLDSTKSVQVTVQLSLLQIQELVGVGWWLNGVGWWLIGVGWWLIAVGWWLIGVS